MRTLLTISAISLAIAACGGGGSGGGEGSSGNGDGSTSGSGLITSKFLAQKCPLSQQTSDPTWWRCLEGGYFQGYSDIDKKTPCSVSIQNGRFSGTGGTTVNYNDAITENRIAHSTYSHVYSPAQGAHIFRGQIHEKYDENGEAWAINIETTVDRTPGVYESGYNNIQMIHAGSPGTVLYCYIPSLVIGK